MRDRLIELISQVQYMGGLEGKLADHLLAAGVIVPPCKVGDTFYYIDKYSNSVETDAVVFFTVTKDGCKAILRRHNKRFWEYQEWGKTVFLTKEEAEKALSERSGSDG